MANTGNLGLNPLEILRQATRSVPAVRYALGVAGIVAAVAIAGALTKDVRVAVIGTVAMLAGMVALFAFAKFGTLPASAWRVPVQVFFWFFVLYVMAAATLLFTSVFFSKPLDLGDTFAAKTPRTDAVDDLANKIGDAPSESATSSAIDALRAYAITLDAGSQDRAVRKMKALLFGKFRDRSEDRRIRRTLVEAIKAIRKGDLRNDFNGGELAEADLVGADLRNTNMSGIRFTHAFLIETDFSGADLSRASFKDARMRNVKLSGAIVAGVDFSGADWFNALGLTKEQLASSRRETLNPCPRPQPIYSEQAFIKFANDEVYGYPFSSWGSRIQDELRSAWSEYSKRGGVCETVTTWSSPASRVEK